MPDKLLTIAEIAKQLDIPESTARYYRDRFESYVPSVGEGRKKRYLPKAAEVLRFIAEGFNRNATATDIEEALSRVFPRNIEFHDETAVTTAVAQQQSISIPTEVISHFAVAMQTIAEQKQEIAELRQRIAAIEDTKDQHEERARQIEVVAQEMIVQNQELRQQVDTLITETRAERQEREESERKKGWFSRIFRK